MFDKLLPFELEVMYSRLKYWAGDHMAYLDALNGLLKRSKSKARSSGKSGDTASVAMWQERGSRIALMIASELVEIKVGKGDSRRPGELNFCRTSAEQRSYWSHSVSRDPSPRPFFVLRLRGYTCKGATSQRLQSTSPSLQRILLRLQI